MNHIPPSARKVCRLARKNGHLLYIASGRAIEQIPASILKLGFDGVISSAGAYIQAAGAPVFSAFFPPPLLERLIQFFSEKKAPFSLETPGKISATRQYLALVNIPALWTPKGLAFRLFISFLRRQTAPLEDGFDKEKGRKIVFLESSRLRFEDVKKEFGAECELCENSIPFSDGGGGEITPKGVTKGTAAERVAQFYGVSREDTFAFGDGDNDRAMLEYAGIGIAMGNSSDNLKTHADDVTDAVNCGGLEKSFRKYGLV